MPVIYPIWSTAFHTLCPLAKRKQKLAMPEFIKALEDFNGFWAGQPPACDDEAPKIGTLQTAIPATHQQELDELLMCAVHVCSQKCKMLIEAGASVNASTLWSKKRAIFSVAKCRDASLMKVFIEDETLWEMRYMAVGTAKALQDELLEEYSSCYAFARILDTAIIHNSLDMIKVILAKVDIAKCIEFDDAWEQTSDNINGCIMRHTTAIVRAITSNKPDIVEFLVSKGYNINAKSTKRRLAASNCIRCTNPECYPPRATSSSGKKTLLSKPPSLNALDKIVWDSAKFAGDVWPRKQITLAQVKMPRIFASCNPVMYELLVRLGATMQVDNIRAKICPRGVHEHESSLMDDRRLAFAMCLQERLGLSSKAKCIDEEMARLILSDATPRANLVICARV